MSTRKHHNTDRHAMIKSNPIAVAMAKHKMRSHLRTISIEIFLLQEGEFAKGLIAHIAWVIGLGAEIAAQTNPGSAQAKRLHSMLRNVVQLAIDGCTWRVELAEPIHQASQAAGDLLMKHADLAMACVPDADYIASRIDNAEIQMSDIAGAEVYQRLEAHACA